MKGIIVLLFVVNLTIDLVIETSLRRGLILFLLSSLPMVAIIVFSPNLRSPMPGLLLLGVVILLSRTHLCRFGVRRVAVEFRASTAVAPQSGPTPVSMPWRYWSVCRGFD
jgi:hypothetical protein